MLQVLVPDYQSGPGGSGASKGLPVKREDCPA